MAQLAKMHKQRKVKRNSWKTRFTKQRVIPRGSSGVAAAAVPTLASIAPTSITAAGTPIQITCTGTGFVANVTTAVVGQVDVGTTFVSATSVTFMFPRPQLPGTVQVNVRNGTKFSTTPRTLTLT